MSRIRRFAHYPLLSNSVHFPCSFHSNSSRGEGDLGSPSNPTLGGHPLRPWRSPANLESEVIRSWDRIDAKQLEAAYYGLKMLDGFPSSSLMGRLADKTLELEDQITARNAAFIFSAVSRLKYYNRTLFNCLAAATIKESKCYSLRGFYCGMIIYNLGVLHRYFYRTKPFKKWNEGGYFPLQEELVNCLIEQMLWIRDESRQTNQNLSNCIYGLGGLKCKHEVLLGVLVEEAMRVDRMESFNEQEISNMIYSFGLLEFRPSHLISNFCEILSRSERLRTWKEQGLANVIYGFSLLQYRPPNQTMYMILWETCRAHRLARFHPQHLMNIIHGLTQLGVKSFRVYKSLVEELSSRQKQLELAKFGLVSVVYALSTIGMYLEGLKGFYEDLTHDRVITQLSDQALTNLIVSFGKFNEDSEELFEFMEKCIKEANCKTRIQRFTERHFSQILLGISKSNLASKLDVNLLEPIVRGSMQITILRSYTDQGLANLVYALTHLKFHEVSLHDLICQEVLQRVHDLKGITLSTLVYSWGLIPYKNEAFLEAVETQLSQLAVLEGYSERVLGNLLFGLIRMDFKKVEILNKILMRIQHPDLWYKFVYSTSPERIEELLKVNWIDQIMRNTLEANLKLSQSQKRNITI